MSSLDPALLHKARRHASGKIIARCPACAETGNDRTGNHLAIFPDGRFACAAHPGDSDHRKRIHALVGNINLTHSPSERREWKQQAARDEQRRKETTHLTEMVKAHRQALISLYPWHPADVWEDSPQPIDDQVATCPRTSLKVLRTPYTVLDFDGFDHIKPTTPEELDHHLHASLALIRWLRESLRWHLAALLHTGGKSLHAWFHTPQPSVLTTLRNAAGPLGIDAGLIGRAEHPCRLPGQVHQGTGNLSRVMWLGLPAAQPH